MSTLALEIPSHARAIPLRHRRDVVVEPVTLRGQRRWHLKDPLSLRYWQFGEEELYLWRQLDGAVSLSEWQARFERRFAPRRIEPRELQRFLGMLHREGLVSSDTASQADTLLARSAAERRRTFFRAFTNLLAIRFRGINPDPWLNRAYPAVAWMFRPAAVAAVGLLAVSALVLVMINWTAFVSRLPEGRSFFTGSGLLWLAVALAGTKVLHELGHAFACKHVGGECHELGVLLLVFTPCLYCNVSDVWLIPDKWRRIAVSAAGMYVEFLLAAVATWLWWFSEPGMLNSLCLSVMAVCSLGTVLFNANPLLRYDGYFILTDLVETPNLGMQADARLRGFLARWLLGTESSFETENDAHGQGGGLLLYGIASLSYRLFLVTLISWFFWSLFAAYRLEVLGTLLVSAMLLGMAWPAGKRIWEFSSRPRPAPRFRRRRATLAVAAALLGAAIIFAVPLPRAIRAPATIRPCDAESVFVAVPGSLAECLPAGSRVRRGDVLATLRNDELDFEIARLTGERDVLRRQFQSLQRQRVDDPRSGAAGTGGQSTVVEQALADAERQLRERIADREKLVLKSPVDGVVLAPPPRPEPGETGELPVYAGSPLEPANAGCFLETGTLLCQIGSPGKLEAVAFVEQGNIEVLEAGAKAAVRLDEAPATILSGTIAGISNMNRREAPAALAAKRRLPRQSEAQDSRLAGTFFEVLITLSDESSLPFGSTGIARISAPRQTIARRLHHWLGRTFRFL